MQNLLSDLMITYYDIALTLWICSALCAGAAGAMIAPKIFGWLTRSTFKRPRKTGRRLGRGLSIRN